MTLSQNDSIGCICSPSGDLGLCDDDDAENVLMDALRAEPIVLRRVDATLTTATIMIASHRSVILGWKNLPHVIQRSRQLANASRSVYSYSGRGTSCKSNSNNYQILCNQEVQELSRHSCIIHS